MQQRAEAKRNKQKSQERRRAEKASGAKKTQEKKRNQKPDLESLKQDTADIVASSYEDSKERSKGGRRRISKLPGGERPGAKANKEAMEEVQRKLEQCVMKEDFDKVNEELQRAVSSVTIFRTQLKLFEKKFSSEKKYDDSLSQTKDVMKSIDKSFDPISNTNSSIESKMA